MSHVITISREFGSGGRELGLRLAEKLGIPFYDKELIYVAAKESDIAEDVFHEYEESVDHVEIPAYTPFSNIYQVPMSDQIFLAQGRAIKKLAGEGPCVIVGRCADMVLEDSVNLFICAPMKRRLERMLTIEKGAEPREMERRIREIDRKRKDYYQYYTGNTWGRAPHYDLCLNTGKAGIAGCLETVLAYLDTLEK